MTLIIATKTMLITDCLDATARNSDKGFCVKQFLFEAPASVFASLNPDGANVTAVPFSSDSLLDHLSGFSDPALEGKITRKDLVFATVESTTSPHVIKRTQPVCGLDDVVSTTTGSELSIGQDKNAFINARKIVRSRVVDTDKLVLEIIDVLGWKEDRKPDAETIAAAFIGLNGQLGGRIGVLEYNVNTTIGLHMTDLRENFDGDEDASDELNQDSPPPTLALLLLDVDSGTVSWKDVEYANQANHSFFSTSDH